MNRAMTQDEQALVREWLRLFYDSQAADDVAARTLINELGEDRVCQEACEELRFALEADPAAVELAGEDLAQVLLGGASYLLVELVAFKFAVRRATGAQALHRPMMLAEAKTEATPQVAYRAMAFVTASFVRARAHLAEVSGG